MRPFLFSSSISSPTFLFQNSFFPNLRKYLFRKPITSSFFARTLNRSLKVGSVLFCSYLLFNQKKLKALENSNSNEDFVIEPTTGMKFPKNLKITISEIDSIEPAVVEQVLIGKGVRYVMMFFKTYSAGFYLEKDVALSTFSGIKPFEEGKPITSENVLKHEVFFPNFINSPFIKSVRIISDKEIAGKHIKQGFKASLVKIIGQNDDESISHFIDLLPDNLKAGIPLDVVWNPILGSVHIRVDDVEKGIVKGNLLGSAFFKMYLGDSPTDSYLKSAIATDISQYLSKTTNKQNNK